jgi:NTE family protein
MSSPQLGLALGGGGARGAAHVGVLQALEKHGIVPDIICGTSAGALVGGAHAAGRLDAMETWIRSLTGWRVLKTMDLRLTGGGFLRGDKVRTIMGEAIPDALRIETLERPFGAVATDLANGREVWLRDGALLDAVYASCALPGLFTPARRDGTWLADGGLANPVPVSLCRALGADQVIAVDLNHDVMRHLLTTEPESEEPEEPEEEPSVARRAWDWLNEGVRDAAESLFNRNHEQPGAEAPALIRVATAAVNIMQERITRARMAGDPPDVLLVPRVGNLSLLDYDKADGALQQIRDALHDGPLPG